MTTKSLFALLSCTAIFILTFFASIAVAQIFDEEKPPLSQTFSPTGITGAWRFNHAESDDVLTKIGELLIDRADAAPTDDQSDQQQSGQPAVSISLFAPEALILSNGDADEITINEIFKTMIETRTVSVDGTLREYEIYPEAKVAITATGNTDGFTVETVSPRGNKMTETFRLASGGAKLIIVVCVEHLHTGEVLNLRRVYNRERADTSFVAE